MILCQFVFIERLGGEQYELGLANDWGVGDCGCGSGWGLWAGRYERADYEAAWL